jgi:hypothetical protein
MTAISKPSELVDEMPAAVRVLLAPVRASMDVCSRTKDKPLSEITMTELVHWTLVISYATFAGYVGGRLLGNLAVAAVRGPARR